jgi:hypothetical protein
MTKAKPEVHVEMPSKRYGNVVSSPPWDEDAERKKDLKHHADQIKTISGMLGKWDSNKAMVTDQAKASLKKSLRHHQLRHAGVKAEIAAAKSMKK